MKILAIFLVMLVGTFVLNGPIQSYADPQLDALLRIAIQARDNLRLNISQINNVPDEINNLFKQGSDETDALSKVVDKQDAVSARQHFLSAMEFFKSTNDKINSLNATQASDQQQLDTLQLQDEITKLESVGARLKAIAITNNADFNFTQFDQLIEKAKQDLNDGNINEVTKSIEAANHIIIDAHHALAEVAQQRTANRAKDFTEKQIERLNSIDLNMTTNSTIATPKISSISKINSNLTSNQSPSDMIAKLRTLVTEGKVDEALKILKLLDESRKAKLVTSENPEQSHISANNIIGNNETKSHISANNIIGNNETKSHISANNIIGNNETKSHISANNIIGNNETKSHISANNIIGNNETKSHISANNIIGNNETKSHISANNIIGNNETKSHISANNIIGNNETKSQAIQKGSSSSNQQKSIKTDKTQKDRLEKQKLEKTINQNKSLIKK